MSVTPPEPFAGLAREIYVLMWSGDLWKQAGTEPGLRAALETLLTSKIERAARQIAETANKRTWIGQKEVAQILTESLGAS